MLTASSCLVRGGLAENASAGRTSFAYCRSAYLVRNERCVRCHTRVQVLARHSLPSEGVNNACGAAGDMLGEEKACATV